MSTKKPKPVEHDTWLRERLTDRAFAAEYLSAAAADHEPSVYLLALRKVAEAQGMVAVAARAGIPRESLYRATSPRGNPRWVTLAAILKATGMCIAVTPGKTQRKRARAAAA